MAFRAATKNENTVASDTITKPTGTVDGDLIILVAITDSNTGTVTWPSGFTETSVTPLRTVTQDAGSLFVATKIASSEPASWTVATSVNSKRMAASWSGVDTTTPIHRISGVTRTTSPGTPWPEDSAAFSGGNTTIAGCDIVMIVNDDANVNGPCTHTPPTGFSTSMEFTAVDIYSGVMYTRDNRPAGETGAYSGTGAIVGAAADRAIAVLALAPIQTAPPPTFLAGDDDSFIPQVELPGYPRISYS